MLNLYFQVKSLLLSKQIFRFFFVAVLATILNYSIFFCLYEFFNIDYRIASGIGFISGVFLGYFLNSKYTFKITERSKKRIVKYYSVYIVSLCISLVCLDIFVEEWKIDARIANLMAICITFCTNYAGTRFWVFRK